MTESEAKRYGEDYLKDLVCAVCKVEDRHKDFVRMSINALEKQVPKKPKTDDRYVMYICPCCNDFIKVSQNYCPNCGQRIDFGE